MKKNKIFSDTDFAFLITYCICLVVFWVIGYLVVSWVVMDLNCMRWPAATRGTFAVWFFACFIICGFLAASIDN